MKRAEGTLRLGTRRSALATTQSTHLGEVALKLAALLRRAEADGEGLLPDGEMALLRGALRDLRRLGRPPVAVQA